MGHFEKGKWINDIRGRKQERFYFFYSGPGGERLYIDMQNNERSIRLLEAAIEVM